MVPMPAQMANIIMTSLVIFFIAAEIPGFMAFEPWRKRNVETEAALTSAIPNYHRRICLLEQL